MYLRSFVIGSSLLVFFPFFYAVNNHEIPLFKLSILAPSKRNYSFIHYAFVAPLFLGIFNMISLFVSMQYGLSISSRYLWTSMVVPKIVILYAYFYKMYNFNYTDWFIYSCLLFIGHYFVWNYIVAYLEYNI